MIMEFFQLKAKKKKKILIISDSKKKKKLKQKQQEKNFTLIRDLLHVSKVNSPKKYALLGYLHWFVKC